MRRKWYIGNGISEHARAGGGHGNWTQPGGPKSAGRAGGGPGAGLPRPGGQKAPGQRWPRWRRSWSGASAPGWPECPWWRSPRSWMSPGPASIGTCPRQRATSPDTGAICGSRHVPAAGRSHGHGSVSGPVASPFAMRYPTLGSLRMYVGLLASSPSLRRSCLAAVRTRRESPDLRRP